MFGLFFHPTMLISNATPGLSYRHSDVIKQILEVIRKKFL
jgi:hypothetical protein